MPDPAKSKSAGVRWLRGEPRWCGLLAWAKAPGFVGFGGSRDSAGIVRIAWLRSPWLQQASAGHPWPACARSPYCRVFRHLDVRGFVDIGSGMTKAMSRRSGEHQAAKDVAAWGCCPSGTWTYRARVLEQDAEPRGGQHPHVAAAPRRSRGFSREPQSAAPGLKLPDVGRRQSVRACDAAMRAQVDTAASRLEGSARPRPARSSAVPWSTATRG